MGISAIKNLFSKAKKDNLKKGPVCLHIHLFKNAGSTVDYALERNFGKRFYLFDDFKNPRNVYSKDDLKEFLANHPDALAVASHQMRFPLPDDMELLTMAFVRHPIDRAFSVYYFEKKQGSVTPGSTKAGQSTMAEYFEWRISQSRISVVTNFQADVFAWGAVKKGGPNEAYLEAARERMRQCTVLGLVERVDESLVYAEHVMKPYYPSIDLAYVLKNVKKGRAASIEDRVAAGRAEAGEEIFKQILDLNDMDLELHKFANDLLDERLSAIPDLDARVADFRERCSTLSGKGSG